MNPLVPVHCDKKEEKDVAGRSSNVAQMFSYGQSEYIMHTSVMSMAARARVTDGDILYTWIVNVQLVYVGLAQARPNY